VVGGLGGYRFTEKVLTGNTSLRFPRKVASWSFAS